MNRHLSGKCLLLALIAAGCGDLPVGATKNPSVQQAKQPQTKKSSIPPVQSKAAKTTKPTSDRAASTQRKKIPTPSRATETASPARTTGRAEEIAVKKIATVIKDSLEVGPTLVVWIIDRTPSAQEIVHEVSAAAQDYYQSPELRELAAAEGSPLLTAILAFDELTHPIVDPPTADWQKAKAGLGAIQPSSGNREMTFTAIKSALDKYLPFRTTQRRELVLVVVTDEAGDDGKIVDELVEPMRRQAIPLYVIGLPAPWGQMNPLAANPKAVEPGKDDSPPVVGPDSLQSERVDIENWTSHYATRGNTSLIDSGFGPFALERLCRATRGQFIALRPGLGFGYRGISAQTWPTGDELRFEEKVVSKYAPDYVSEAEYHKLLAENKARAALCAAAKLPKVSIEGSPGSRFPKAIEAKMAKQMSAAQQFAARNSPEVDKLYNLLAPGESDRGKLTSPRWQAEFDLAMGRVLANKARLDGYNSMIAALKRGKAFQKPESKEWVLESADNFETESTIKKMAEKAKLYLDRVIQKHPGTPWAKIAEEELRLPLGWAWKEV